MEETDGTKVSPQIIVAWWARGSSAPGHDAGNGRGVCTDRYAHTDADRYCYADPWGLPHTHAYTYHDGHPYTYAYTAHDGHRYAHTYIHRDGHPYTHTDAHAGTSGHDLDGRASHDGLRRREQLDRHRHPDG